MYVINAGNKYEVDKGMYQRWQPLFSSAPRYHHHPSLVSNGPLFVHAVASPTPGPMIRLVALASIRQGEIKHATVTRLTRRIQLPLLTCDIKKPASVGRADKRDTGEQKRGEGDVMSGEMKAFQLLIDYYSTPSPGRRGSES